MEVNGRRYDEKVEFQNKSSLPVSVNYMKEGYLPYYYCGETIPSDSEINDRLMACEKVERQFLFNGAEPFQWTDEQFGITISIPSSAFLCLEGDFYTSYEKMVDLRVVVSKDPSFFTNIPLYGTVYQELGGVCGESIASIYIEAFSKSNSKTLSLKASSSVSISIPAKDNGYVTLMRLDKDLGTWSHYANVEYHGDEGAYVAKIKRLGLFCGNYYNGLMYPYRISVSGRDHERIPNSVVKVDLRGESAYCRTNELGEALFYLPIDPEKGRIPNLRLSFEGVQEIICIGDKQVAAFVKIHLALPWSEWLPPHGENKNFILPNILNNYQMGNLINEEKNSIENEEFYLSARKLGILCLVCFLGYISAMVMTPILFKGR